MSETMANKQQTAVEWAFEQISNIDWKHLSDSDRNNLFNQALQMEREQIEKAWDDRGKIIVARYFLEENINGEQYYNQTYSLPD